MLRLLKRLRNSSFFKGGIMETLRQIIMDLGLLIDSFAGEVIMQSEFDSWEESLGFKLQNLGWTIFGLGYSGSDHEIKDALIHSEEEWPSTEMTDRQRAARRNAPSGSNYFQTSGRLV